MRLSAWNSVSVVDRQCSCPVRYSPRAMCCCTECVGRVVALGQLAQQHTATVVQHHRYRLARAVVGLDLALEGDIVGGDRGLVVLAGVLVALGRTLVVVKGDARREHIDERKARVLEARLDERHELCLIARKASRNEARAKVHGEQHRVDGRLLVDLALFGLGTDIRRGRELAFGQAIHTVVLDDVEHVGVAADGVAELPETDGERIAVTRDADVVEVAVGGVGTHGDRGHAPVHRVETVRTADEIGRGLRGAAYP